MTGHDDGGRAVVADFGLARSLDVESGLTHTGQVLGGLAGPERLPVNAIALTAVVAVVFILLAGSQFYNILVNFNIIGFYIAFGVPVIGAAIARAASRTWT